MDQKLGGTEQRDGEVRQRERRLDLTVPQVAGSALAAVAAAVLASQLGVYGTVIGAGVVSVVATAGGSVFQQLFRRTGEQIRVVTVQTKPGGRRGPVRDGRNDPGDPGDVTWALSGPAGRDGRFGEATTHGSRIRGWKRPALGAVAVFVVAMIGITGYELISGQDLSGGKGTTVGSVVRGGDRSVPPQAPADSPDPGPTPGGRTPDDGVTPGGSAGDGPSTGPEQDDESATPHSPTPTPSRPGDTPASQTPSPTPTPSGSPGDTAGAGGADGGVTGRHTGPGTADRQTETDR
ncbi:hypothetical protein [Streptomyces sp. AK02-01A]|uniref:hypothetical protein n=1 Tax=Streptomyces sp. AK02-01A TaxID=3028648 RepID=UPI0029AE89CC|nr:hypothetical protein [Streptomyces sp. AK02-01A]MDX3851929.1 hypothetical protein [Streptomyces sp. AK02-01A]